MQYIQCRQELKQIRCDNLGASITFYELDQQLEPRGPPIQDLRLYLFGTMQVVKQSSCF